MAKKSQVPPPINKLRLPKQLLVGSLITLILLIAALASFWLILSDKIYPGVDVASTNLTGLTKPPATQKLETVLARRLDQPLQLTYLPRQQAGQPATSSAKTQQFQIKIKLANLPEASQQALDEAFQYGHRRLFRPPIHISIKLVLAQSVDKQLEEIAAQIDQPPVEAQLRVADDQITVSPSQQGWVVDQDLLKQSVIDYLNSGQNPPTLLPIKQVSPKLSYENALEIKKRLDQIKLSPLKLTFKDRSFPVDLATILTLIDLQKTDSILATALLGDHQLRIKSATIGTNEYLDTKLSLDQDKINQFMQGIATKIDRPVIEPLFSFDPSQPSRVKEFQPPQEGYQLDVDKSINSLTQALLTQHQTVVPLAVTVIPPKNKLVNDLGIKELLGRGISHFSGSIANRIYNIKLTAQRLNGVLVKPGDIFSFNATVGEISAATGFKQAYVIKSGRTVLDDGGGVCQDSTTLFRAVLKAGLPVVKRTAHAYRVGYYEQGFPPGLDATVFAPTVDFQFTNDTPAHILIQAYTSGESLYVDLYGTSDGRMAKISTPTITNQTPPPTELRQDDPTLPKGVVKQVDWAAWGANVTFTRTVVRGTETLINETYRSNYRPWQAVFLVGTKEN